MANTVTTFTELDFFALKQAFIAFLQGQDQWKDYSFTDSNFNVLLDILAQNTEKNAFYDNMVLAENFLDSAQLRSSVASRAKELNYLPGSAHSSQAVVNLTFQGQQPSYLIQKGQSFSAVVRETSLTFSVGDTVLLTSPNGSFSSNLTLFEGPYVSDTYVVLTQTPPQRMTIRNANVDTESVSVVVYEGGSVLGNSYTYATTLLGLNETSKVFFLQQSENGLYEVLFGDGVLGYRPPDGSLAVFDYRVSVGDAGNGARSFSINFSPSTNNDVSNINVTTISAANGGVNPETLDSIRFRAPRHFEAQERAVSELDFPVMLQEQFPEIQNISVYGGEKLNPPLYGRVIAAIRIAGVDGLPFAKVQQYTDFIENGGRMFLTGRIVFVEPEFSYLAVSTSVTYNLNDTALSSDNIQALVSEAISNFDADELEDFAVRFKYSKFCDAIDSALDAIVDNDTSVLLFKRIAPPPAVPTNVAIKFSAELAATMTDTSLTQPDSSLHSLFSSSFVFGGAKSRLGDDGAGNVWIVSSTGGTEKYALKVGTVDYQTGYVSLSALTVDSYDGTFIDVYVRTAEKDVVADQATILGIDLTQVSITMVATRN